MTADTFSYLKTLFEQNADDANSAAMASYMRNLFPFYGIPTPKRRELYGDILARERRAGRVDWELLDMCWEEKHREFQYFVTDYLYKMRKFLTFDDMPRLEGYARTKQWWDSVDLLCRTVGAIAAEDRRMDGLMLKWSTGPDFWLRRIAICHQLGRKDRTDAPLLEKILLNNLDSTEFFVNRAVGWALRDYSKTDPEWVRDFLERYGGQMDKLSVREARKYL